MEYRAMIRLQKCIYFNQYIYAIWFTVVIFFLYVKLDKLDHLSKYLSVTSFVLLFIIEVTRLYLAHYGNLSSRVPELAGFLMLTILMQMPLVSFFVFNPYLLSTHTEYVLHISLLLITVLEIIFGFLALNHASSVAKSIYLSHSRQVKY
ncbi:PREDICTED: transmembrane protein 17-like [Papilio xuthus]|uniref:Transmembrane protein 17-like n=1 Tax=Papilio xuthus TaxID=66420 RepID=A0AAJ6ZYN3_PAPXU|nr:PREDICTED: transmembrane protein 17-like [Papilio xuthus]